MDATSPIRITLAGLAATVLSFTAQSAPAASDERPETFVRRIYAQYDTSDNSTGVDRTRPAGSAFYAAPLLDAFAKDDALLHGEIGVIDSDPLCACQAWDHLRVKGLALTKGEAGTVKARVVIGNFLGPQRVRVVVVLTLSRTPAGWRIADVGDDGRASLMAALRGEIRELTHVARPVATTPAQKP